MPWLLTINPESDLYTTSSLDTEDFLNLKKNALADVFKNIALKAVKNLSEDVIKSANIRINDNNIISTKNRIKMHTKALKIIEENKQIWEREKEDRETHQVVTRKITEELFSEIEKEMMKICRKDQIPSIDKIIKIIDISQGSNLKKKLPFYYNYKKRDVN
jgi:hypothetical protein